MVRVQYDATDLVLLCTSNQLLYPDEDLVSRGAANVYPVDDCHSLQSGCIANDAVTACKATFL